MKLHPDLVQLAPNRVTANGRTGRNCQAALIALFDLAQNIVIFSSHFFFALGKESGISGVGERRNFRD